jgi:hypothetical protein
MDLDLRRNPLRQRHPRHNPGDAMAPLQDAPLEVVRMREMRWPISE